MSRSLLSMFFFSSIAYKRVFKENQSFNPVLTLQNSFVFVSSVYSRNMNTVTILLFTTVIIGVYSEIPPDGRFCDNSKKYCPPLDSEDLDLALCLGGYCFPVAKYGEICYRDKQCQNLGDREGNVKPDLPTCRHMGNDGTGFCLCSSNQVYDRTTKKCINNVSVWNWSMMLLMILINISREEYNMQ